MMGFNPLPNAELAKKTAAYLGMGDTAENVATKYQISRAQQEAFAVASQDKAASAIAAGKLEAEIVPIPTKAGIVDKDGTPRPGTTVEALAGLKPAFAQEGTVTAGTSSPLTDGASAVLIASEDYALANGLPILARIKSVAVSGCQPEIMGIGPVEASRKALGRAGLDVGQLDIVELNEAFASQSLACISDLGLDVDKVNVDGGAIAIGHPLGATGARIVGKAAALLKREGGKYALATQCIGGGQGIATVLEAAE
jgi:acetyl-CoA acyltransferase